MKKWILLHILLLFLVTGPLAVSCLAATSDVTMENADIVGAGATFPAPLYQQWIREFAQQEGQFTIYYDGVGSGSGTKRFIAGQVDFGASDFAMTDDQIAQVSRGVQLVPATAGIVVLAYNLPGVKGELRLSREVYTDIFFGRIKYWNDSRISKLNPGIEFPHLNIVTVVRNDSSGTTYAFTNHLGAINREWKNNGPGVGTKVDWPGNSMYARYNEGIAVKIRNSWGAIGYLEYGTAKRAGLDLATLENKEGNFIRPDDSSGTVTLRNTAQEMPGDMRLFMPDPAGADSYPIVTYSWLLLYRQYDQKAKADKVKAFVSWGLTKGQTYAAKLGYAPLPESVVANAKSALQGVQ